MKNSPSLTMHDKPSVPRELRSLAAEVRKFRIAEEFVARNVISVDPRKLEPSEPLNGNGQSVSKGPVDVYLDRQSGAMIIEDGHHRVSEAIARGDTTIDAHVTIVETDPEEGGLASDVTAEFFETVKSSPRSFDGGFAA